MRPAGCSPQALASEKESAERGIARLAAAAADDLGLALDKSLKLEWHKAANTRTRCLRITQKDERAVRARLQAKWVWSIARVCDAQPTTCSSLQSAARMVYHQACPARCHRGAEPHPRLCPLAPPQVQDAADIQGRGEVHLQGAGG